MNMDDAGTQACTQCGSSIAAEDNFCSSCGTKKVVAQKPTVVKKKYCENCSAPADFSVTECGNCFGTAFTHIKPENIDESVPVTEAPVQDLFKAARPQEVAAPSDFDWRAHKKLIIGSAIVIIGFCSLIFFTSVFKNYASTEQIIMSADSSLQPRICAEDDRTAATSLIRENKDPNLEFKEGEGLGFAIFDEVKRVCATLLKEDTYLAKAVADIKEQERLEQVRIEEERKAAEKLRVKWEPVLNKWDDRAREAGLGDLSDYLSATARAESLITAGAQYSLTGAEREVQSASCWATQYSLWSQGEPGGWWSCYINFLGGGDSYSVEFSSGNWSGRADAGSRAGRDLNWKIPDGLLSWMNSR